MRKTVSFIMAALTLVLAMNLSACNLQQDAQQFISKGEWLHNINLAFGMLEISQTAPINKSIGTDKAHYEDVQIAAAWGVVAADETIDTEALVTKQYAVNTLLNVGNFLSAEDAERSDKEKAELAKSKGFLADKKSLSRKIKREDAEKMLKEAQSAWANRKVEEPYFKQELAEGVKDLGEINANLDYSLNGNKLSIKDGADIALAPGEVILLPSTTENLGGASYRVQSAKKSGDDLLVTISEDKPEMEDVLETMIIQETFVPNFLNGGTIYDGNGNPITPTPSAEAPPVNDVQMPAGASAAQPSYLAAASNPAPAHSAQTPSAMPMAYNPYNNNAAVKNLDTSNANLRAVEASFGYDGWEIDLAIKSNSLKIGIGKTLSETKGKGVKSKNEVSASIEFFQPEITLEQHWEWFQLKSCTMKVDYKTKVSSAVKCSFDTTALKVAPYDNRNGNIISNFKYIGLHKGSTPGAEKIKICKIPTPLNVCGAGLWLEVSAHVKVSGEIELSVTVEGAKGLEYSNGNARYIQEAPSPEFAVEFQAKIECTVLIAVSVRAAGFDIAGIYVSGGLGLKIEPEANVVDGENHLIEEGALGEGNAGFVAETIKSGARAPVSYIKQIAASRGGAYVTNLLDTDSVDLSFDICFNLKIYPIFEFGVESNCLLYGILNEFGFKLKIRLIGEESAFSEPHIESFNELLSSLRGDTQWHSECIKEYTPFEGETIEETSTEPVDDSGTISISSYFEDLKVGDTYILTATAPGGYTAEDLKFESDDPAVATVDRSGKITGVSPGSATIKVYTADEKKAAFCGVYVQ